MKLICKTVFVGLLFAMRILPGYAQGTLVSFQNGAGFFALSVNGRSAPVLSASGEYPGVVRAIKNLRTDIGAVTGKEPPLLIDHFNTDHTVVIVGTIGKNPLLDQLARSKKISFENVAGKWETYLIQGVENPFPGIDRALVIAGSDKRGTIFGLYEVSKAIGVSPWYWWADVPPQHHENLYVVSGPHSAGEPAVKYRGLFLNDEEPSLGRWAVKTYGGFNHAFYEKLFELILRLKGNYLWPAMWWASFNSDDPLNPELADEYGIVMGTTHHEPLMRAHAEWKTYHGGDWNYETNAAKLDQFWTEGIRRMGSRESIVSIGMRGDGDLAMTAETNIALLERIVARQRNIIHEVTGKDPASVPQLWALYKEVQDYYDKGMRVPDDVTLLLCDDNWGNVRKLPKPGDKPRAGGYGMYYHFDYVGGPRNYKWVNTNPITKAWEQLHLTYEYGVDRIWIVNVGDLKPLEFPIEFFMDYAWNPKSFSPDNLGAYTISWAARQFGPAHASEIADLIERYTKINGRRKPELLSPDTYSLVNYHEAEKVVADYDTLTTRAKQLMASLPASLKDAFYELVLYPVEASANLNALYFAVARNRWYADQGRAATNDLDDVAKRLFQKDKDLATYYNKTLAGGKWDNMMNQVHIGYTIWQDPAQPIMPETKTVALPDAASMGVAIEGSASAWPSSSGAAVLPAFDANGVRSRDLEIFNRGKQPFDFSIKTNVDWLTLSASKGKVEKEKRITVGINWNKAPSGIHPARITISGPTGTTPVDVLMSLRNVPIGAHPDEFIEADGYVSMEAAHFSKAVSDQEIRWEVLPDYGRTLSAVTPLPVTASPRIPGSGSPHLDYDFFMVDTATLHVEWYVAPTLNFNGTGLRLAVSVDDETPQVINIHAHETLATWEESVRNSIRIIPSIHRINATGHHILKYWMMDPGIVLEKIVINAGGERPSYLGPPESIRFTSSPR
jgi:hypothetical protein